MRILVLGAGGVGGYFGGRLAEAGLDVTFLVRAVRAKTLKQTGLSITSPAGNSHIDINTVTTETLNSTYDLVLMCCKSYHLDQAMKDIAPAIGPDTVILPLLNGLMHIDALVDHFGGAHVLGGTCHIAATIGDAGDIVHLGDFHRLILGERAGGTSDRIADIAQIFEAANFDTLASDDIRQVMWEKFVMLCSLGGMTCMMRASVGDIMATNDGKTITLELYSECAAIASSEGFGPRDEFKETATALLTNPQSDMTASMMRDMEQGLPVEADHLLGDMLRRAKVKKLSTPILRIAYCHLQAYEARILN